MRKTLNQVIKDFRAFCDAHKMIKSFESKPITQMMAKNLQYPIMWLNWKPGAFATGELIVNADVYFLDRLKKDNSNIDQVISDNLLNANDFYTYFNDKLEDLTFLMDNNAPFAPVVFEYDDELAGWVVSVSIQIQTDRDELEIPMQ